VCVSVRVCVRVFEFASVCVCGPKRLRVSSCLCESVCVFFVSVECVCEFVFESV
jgi:hypothetical protein